jgi:hypothetical protein
MTITRRRLLASMGVAGAATLFGGAPATALRPGRRVSTAARFAGDPGLGRLYYGCSMPYYKDLAAWEDWLGRPLAAHRHYHEADETVRLQNKASADLTVGRLPLASTKSPGTWEDVARGSHDAWLDALLFAGKAVGGPVFLAIHHEPEDDAFTGPGMRPRHWVAMQERAIARAATRAPNVTIVPVLMQWTFDPRSGREPSAWRVPSARVFGFDVYNSWSPTNGKRWTSFADKVDLVLPWTGGRPMVVAEYGCRADPADPERAVRWMQNAFQYALEHDIVAMTYFNSSQNSPEGGWDLEGRQAEAFRTLLARPEVARP